MLKKNIDTSEGKAVSRSKTDSEPTIIANTTVIIGDISATGKLDIQGRVKGNVETSNDLIVSGVIEGNLDGKNILMESASVRGNVKALYDVVIKDTMLLGDVKANNVLLDGKMKGNLVVQESTELTSRALFQGDIDTKELATSLGAKVSGSITTRDSSIKDNEFTFDQEVIKTLEVSGTVVANTDEDEDNYPV